MNSDIKFTIEKTNLETNSVEIIEQDNCKIYNRMNISRNQILALLNMMFTPADFYTSDLNSLELETLWTGCSPIPADVNRILMYFTGAKNSESELIPLYPNTSQDSLFLGYVNTDTPYAGSSTIRGTINDNESYKNGHMSGHLVIDFPTHACNGEINTIHLGRKLVGTSTGLHQYTHYQNLLLPSTYYSSSIFNRTIKENSRYVVTNEFLDKNNNYKLSNIFITDKSSQSPKTITVSPKSLGGDVYDVYVFNDKFYFSSKSMLTQHKSFADMSIYELIINDDNGFITYEVGSKFDLNFMNDAVVGFNSNHQYLVGIVGYHDLFAVITSSSMTTGTNIFINVFDKNKNIITKNYNYSSTDSPYDKALIFTRVTDDNFSFSIKEIINNVTDAVAYSTVTISKTGTITVKNSNTTFDLSKYQLSNGITVGGVDISYRSGSSAKIYGYIIPDKPFISIELEEPLRKTDAETLKLIFDINLLIQ